MRTGILGSVAVLYMVGVVTGAVALARAGTGRRASRGFAVTAAVAVIVMTTLPFAHRDARFSLVPFVETLRLLAWSPPVPLVSNVLGNVGLLVPFGAGLAASRISASRAFALIVALPVGVEVAQSLLPIGRVAAIDDILLNVIGGAAAYVASRRLLDAAGRHRRRAANA